METDPREPAADRRFVVCIPTYLEAASIERATRLVDRAIAGSRYRDACLLVNVDNNSPDGTAALFAATPTRTPRRVITCDAAEAGKGRNLFALFQFCVREGATAAMTVDADLEEVGEEWVDRFLGEAGGADMVLPVYPRRWYEGSLTNQVVVPLIYAATGNAIRQPIAGEFAFSARFMKHMTGVPWPADAWAYGVDVFLTMTALATAEVSQIGLRTGKVQPWRSRSVPGVEREFPPKFRQVVNTLLACLGDAPRVGRGHVPIPPATAEAVFETQDCDLDFMRKVSRSAAARMRGKPEWTELGIGFLGELDDPSWARVLNQVLEWARAGRLTEDRLSAFCAALFVRIAHVQPRLKGLSQAEIDEHVWSLGRAVADHARTVSHGHHTA
ncbi:glycosyltransferase [Actinomadura chibensis]|uniref:Glucosyl-3-phosphoglycerate synthase n=1 Tax=Actinomadura chibensis TaxID=392828 RepID=A0A5D0NWJ1_9ACTN|nr:glycosyltransferase [Actinomadura chibensis]TYB48538.1 glycosyltransferase [Actinomadura chibensis]